MNILIFKYLNSLLQSYGKNTELLCHSFMNSLVSLLLGLYPVLAMHSLLVTIVQERRLTPCVYDVYIIMFTLTFNYYDTIACVRPSDPPRQPTMYLYVFTIQFSVFGCQVLEPLHCVHYLFDHNHLRYQTGAKILFLLFKELTKIYRSALPDMNKKFLQQIQHSIAQHSIALHRITGANQNQKYF